MKKKSTCLLILLFCCFSFNCFSQALYPVSLDEKVQQSTLIAEGTVVSKTSFWNTARTMIYTNNKIKLHKLFKGNSSSEFIEVLTVGGSVGLESVEASDLAELFVGQSGMFFCFPNTIQLKSPETNELLWDIYSSAQGYINYNLHSKTAGAPFAAYSNIVRNLYPMVIAKTGLQPVNVDTQFMVGEEPSPQNEVLAITSFSPASVVAGAHSNPAANVLTINGTDFGAQGGTAAVLFDDANYGSGPQMFEVLSTSNLIVSWTNTQIQVRVPSRAGTGTFQVRDQAGGIVNSATPLNILYAVLSATFTGPITVQSNLMNDNGSGGYTIQYSNSTLGGGVNLDASPVKTTFQRALNTWKEVVGLNVTEGAATTNQVVTGGDGINSIMFDNTNTGNAPLSAGVLGVCYSFNSACGPVGTYPAQKVDFDIVIRNPAVSSGSTPFENGPCYPPADGATIDMETVLLHELGHALNLGHINDDYQYTGSGGYAAVNPGKLMNYAVLVSVARKSLDWAALAGGQYTVNTKGLSYGTCTLSNVEMTPLATTTEAKDECPGTFPTTATGNNTVVNFDLVHATSNKNTDPQYTAVICTGVGRPVTNTAYYAIRTGNSGTLNITVNGYTTSPANQSSCTNDGVKLALYQVSNCPTGQAYPAPVACRNFSANGALTTITGLAANTNYLIFVDGENNTKATFNFLLNGTALPVRITQFNGLVKTTNNEINWSLDMTASVKTVVLEAGINGSIFTPINEQDNAAASDRIISQFNDMELADKKYYRLKMINLDGSIEYSSVLLLRRDVKANTVLITPNPANDHLNILLNRNKTASLSFILSDVSGKIVLRNSQTVAAGTQTIQIDGLGKLAAGTYLLTITDGITKNTHKIIKR